MKVKSAVPVFHVHDLAASLKYYQDILGFTQDMVHENYIGLKIGDAGLHLSAVKTHMPVGGGTVYFICDEVDSYYAQINAKGALVKGEPQEYFYGMRDFIVADPDGNHLSFGCPGATQ
jgi:uncharacterized glyoxalase superfamily protein PhnB